MSWVIYDHGWRHRPWWKVAINTVLRLMQPWVRRKWVVYTVSLAGDDGLILVDGVPKVRNYGFGRIDHGGDR